MIERLADLHKAATDALAALWGALGDPIVTVWATIGAMPLPVALAAVGAGAALFHIIDQRGHARRKE